MFRANPSILHSPPNVLGDTGVLLTGSGYQLIDVEMACSARLSADDLPTLYLDCNANDNCSLSASLANSSANVCARSLVKFVSASMYCLASSSANDCLKRGPPHETPPSKSADRHQSRVEFGRLFQTLNRQV